MCVRRGRRLRRAVLVVHMHDTRRPWRLYDISYSHARDAAWRLDHERGALWAGGGEGAFCACVHTCGAVRGDALGWHECPDTPAPAHPGMASIDDVGVVCAGALRAAGRAYAARACEAVGGGARAAA